MRVVIQRVNYASITVDGEITGEIEKGLAVLVGFGRDDDKSKLEPMAKKILNMRIFSDDNGKFMFSLLDIKGEILLVPQFTLYADTDKGRRPDFYNAMPPSESKPLFDFFVQEMKKEAPNKVATGIFGADMKFKLENDGPVTIWLDL